MNTVLHKAATRGSASHGWLESRHTFSFASYHDPSRVHFGVLRVLNDDAVAPGMGFGKHPHDNMEIISIPLEGDLEHSDNLGNVAVIKQGDVQIMSAGTGVVHAEKNNNRDKPVKFLQIWVIPAQKNVAPRYEQMSFADEAKHNKLVTVVSPVNGSDGGVHIHQNAWFSLGTLDKDVTATYDLKREDNGVYVFVISGDVVVNDVELNQRDGLGISGLKQLSIVAGSPAELLLMEVPMN